VVRFDHCLINKLINSSDTLLDAFKKDPDDACFNIIDEIVPDTPVQSEGSEG
jgi:hypothetical protein